MGGERTESGANEGVPAGRAQALSSGGRTPVSPEGDTGRQSLMFKAVAFPAKLSPFPESGLLAVQRESQHPSFETSLIRIAGFRGCL